MGNYSNLLFLFLTLSILKIGSSVKNDELTSSEVKNGQCGGTIELDSGTLIYPGEGLINPGELCIWTIHLRTMDGFRMNFTNLDLPGQGNQCPGAAVSIFGLTNLIPSDSLETYRFCDENNNGGYHFLTGNVATVVFYTSLNFPPNGPSTGFSLHWEGSLFQRIPIMHSSTYTSTPSGVVWYPVEGEYAPNSALTWLVNGAGPENSSSLIIDILSVDFESCNLGDPCLCDALIIYDISQIGDLHEVDRFCGDREGDVVLQNISSDFLVAFFSDNIDHPDAGLGFRVDWRQQGTTTTTTTTTTEEPSEPTTTSEPEGPIITTCGGVIEADEGTISYFPGEFYSPSERCVWTIRPSLLNNDIELTKAENDFGSGDSISAFSFGQTVGLVQTAQMNSSASQVEMWGSVFIIVFTSDTVNQGTGFNLHFKSLEAAGPVNNGYDFNTGELRGSLRHPVNGSRYANQEVSTVVLTQEYKRVTIPNIAFLTIEEYGIENSTGCVYDGFIIYVMEYTGLRQMGKYCGQHTEPLTVIGTDVIILVFYSDEENVDSGFRISWS